MRRSRSRAELRAIFAKIRETRTLYQSRAAPRETIEASAPLSEAAKVERARIQQQHAPPDWAKDDFSDDSESYDRVVWDVKRGQDLDASSLSGLDVDDSAKEWRGAHITSDTDYWKRRLAEDYGRSRKAARVIRIRPDADDFVIEDPQYVTDPDTGDKADSAVLITRRKKFRYGKDWVFEGEEFTS